MCHGTLRCVKRGDAHLSSSAKNVVKRCPLALIALETTPKNKVISAIARNILSLAIEHSHLE